MDKRYQVFISSTYQDLVNARQEVSQALLRTDCFPAGMELFPAADDEQFEFIKSVIDQSDYYILISAGRYGSIHPSTGLSYTEMEYDYAVGVNKPIIRLLHRDPFNELQGMYIEDTDTGRSKLEKFRQKLIQNSLVRFWNTPATLGAEVVHSLLHTIKTKPAAGWVRASDIGEQQILNKVFDEKEREAQREVEIDDNSASTKTGTKVDLSEYPDCKVVFSNVIELLQYPAFSHIRFSDLSTLFHDDGAPIEKVDEKKFAHNFRLPSELIEVLREKLSEDGLAEWISGKIQQGFFTVERHGLFLTDEGKKVSNWVIEQYKEQRRNTLLNQRIE